MANISGNILTSLSSVLGTLSTTPGALNLLGQHLTQSGEMQAISTLDAMLQNPGNAASLLSALTSIPNLPPAVIAQVTEGIASLPDAQAFRGSINGAKNSLLQTATSPNVLGGLFGNL
jgi:hypothetical protein